MTEQEKYDVDDIYPYNKLSNFRDKIYILILIFGIILCIFTLSIVKIVPKILAEKYTNTYEIKTGCIYLNNVQQKYRYTSIFIADNQLGSDIDNLTIKNSPFFKEDFEKKRSVLLKNISHSNLSNECYLIKYIEVDLKIYKKNFIYDLLEDV